MERLSQSKQKRKNNLPVGLTLLHTLKGHIDSMRSVTWSPDGKQIASSSSDQTIRLWDSTNGLLLYTLEGHTDRVNSVVWSPDGKLLASGSDDKTLRLWDATNGMLLDALEGYPSEIRSVAWSPDGKLAFGCYDGTVQMRDQTKSASLHTLIGHTGRVNSVAWSPDGKQIASGSRDQTVRIWDTESGLLLHTLRGHTGRVNSVAWSPDGKQIASGSYDRTIRLWNATSGALQQTLEGHTSRVRSVAWSPDGRLLASVSYKNVAPSYDANLHIWRTNTWETLAILPNLSGFMHSAWSPKNPLLATVGQQKGEIAILDLDMEYLLGVATSPKSVHYKNAKVVLVGDSGVGKSGLGLVLSGQPFAATESTHGRRVWHFERREEFLDKQSRETHEMLLWDLAGQSGYRLIHQLHLNEVAVALVVFDSHNEIDPFAGVRYWDQALRLAQRIQGSSALPLKKFLAAARMDRGGIGASSERIQAIIEELGFDGYFATSAKEGRQINELREAIRHAIDWQKLPGVSSTQLFRQIKQFLLNEKKQARRLISSIEDLRGAFLHAPEAPTETSEELPDQFETCIRLVESAGLIKRLSFGNLVLIQPEFLDAYASALVNAVKDEPDGLGSISEEQVRAGDFRIPADERMQDAKQEKLLLIAMIEDLLWRELALREEDTLVFPSQSTKENFDLPNPERTAVVFTFEGPVLNIYATLAVRLARSGAFKKKNLWKNAVTYTTNLGGTCGIYLRDSGEGRGELTLFFDQSASLETRHDFTEYIHLYLQQQALPASFNVRYVLTCSTCNEVISENTIRRRKERNFDWLLCPVCGTRVSLVEQRSQSKVAPSPRTQEMDQSANTQREREAAQSILFDVFLCHHGIDKPIVKRIGEQLKEQGILPWLDEWELRPGLPWQRLLEEQIKQIKSAAVFVGKNGMGPWQEQELAAFLRAFVKRGCPVIPVLLEDAPKKPELPIFLEAMTWVDFRIQDPDPLQRLVWGITGKREME